MRPPGQVIVTSGSFGVGEDDAPVDVVPGVFFVALHHGELDAVDELKLFEGEAEGLGDEDIYRDECHAPGVVGAEGTVARPVRREVGEEVLGKPWVGGLAPAFHVEIFRVKLTPQVGEMRR